MVKCGIVEGIVRQEKDFLILLDAMRLPPDAELETLAAYMQHTRPQWIRRGGMYRVDSQTGRMLLSACADLRNSLRARYKSS